MNVLIFDVETTISNHGNAFDQTNKLICVGLKWVNGNQNIIWKDFDGIQNAIDISDVIVGFNIKFDLHWLKKIGIDFSGKKIWDCQLAEFLLEDQLNPYNSLDDAAAKYGLGQKIDVIKLDYWEKGIDTDAIPRPLLSDYLKQDLLLTEQVYLNQRELFKTKEKLYNLFKLQCMDLLVLQEMEYNGILFETEKALEYAKNLEAEANSLYARMVLLVGNVPFNLNSNDHVSAILYGGDIIIPSRIPIGFYKTGVKNGQVRYKIENKVYTLPKLVEPLKRSESKKGGTWKVNNDVLRSLKPNKKAKEILDILNRHGEIEKLRGTYLLGYTKLIETMHWPKDTLYGTLNQCMAVTGRLSSSRPNLQNCDPVTKTFMRSRY